MQNQPNIFNYATSELSQDAFIAWLLTWADAKYKGLNEPLHQLGLDFLQSLLATQNIGLTEISNLEIKTQFYKIDVFVSFIMDGQSYGVIIEDKVFSSNHSGQLKKYKEFIEKKKFDVVVPIYFKTGFQHCYKDVEDKGYNTFTVKDFVKVLQKGITDGIDNAILVNYYEYIIEREKWFDEAKYAFENYKTIPISKWDWWSCSGFFSNQQDKFNAGWGSVGNNKQPLLAFWCKGVFLTIKDVDTDEILNLKLYLDVIYSRAGININFRIGNLKNFPQTNNRNRNKIYKQFAVVLEANNIKYRKPHFKKSKGTLCLAQIKELDKTLMYNDFVLLLKNYNNILKQFAKDYIDE